MEKFYNILRKALVIIGVFSMTSCDFLETEPFDFVSPTTETSLNVQWHLLPYTIQWPPISFMEISIQQK